MDTQTQGSNGIKPIEIFRPGSFTAMNGIPYTFTAAQVQELADSYRPDFADAPLVVGHPKLTSPRFGHASKLFVNAAGVLCAEAADVVPEFAEAVNAKHYPKVSASIYLPDAPGNPAPGKHYLRHIGFLGGAAPAVKGLKSVEFAADQSGIVNFGYEDRLIVQIFRRLREWIVAKDGVEQADQIVMSYQLDDLAEANTREELAAAGAAPQTAFSQPNYNQTEADLNEQQQAAATALAQREQNLATREAQIAAQEAQVRKAGHAEFAETLCVSGQLLPAQKTAVVEILAQLDAANQVAEFAEGDSNHGKTGAALFKDFLAAQPKQVEFGRVAKDTGAQGEIVDFAMPAGCVVDTEGLETYRKAVAYQKEHPGTDLITAAKAVSR